MKKNIASPDEVDSFIGGFWEKIKGTMLLIVFLTGLVLFLVGIFLIVRLPDDTGIQLQKHGIAFKRYTMGRSGRHAYKVWLRANKKKDRAVTKREYRTMFFESYGYPFQMLSKMLNYPLKRLKHKMRGVE